MFEIVCIFARAGEKVLSKEMPSKSPAVWVSARKRDCCAHLSSPGFSSEFPLEEWDQEDGHSLPLNCGHHTWGQERKSLGSLCSFTLVKVLSWTPRGSEQPGLMLEWPGQGGWRLGSWAYNQLHAFLPRPLHEPGLDFSHVRVA